MFFTAALVSGPFQGGAVLIRRGLTAVVCVMWMSGCGAAANSLRSLRSSAEPQTIVLRNATQTDLASMTVRDGSSSPSATHRLGRVAPALSGAEVAFLRRPNAEPLPRRVVLAFQSRSRVPGALVLDLRPVLARATGSAQERLVFELATLDRAEVHLDSGRGTRRY